MGPLRIVALFVGGLSLLTASAMLVVASFPTEARVVHIHRIEGGADLSVNGEAKVRAVGSVTVNFDIDPVVVKGLPPHL